MSARPLNVGVHDSVTESQQTTLGGKRKAREGEKGVCIVSQLFLPETVVKSCVSLTSKYIFVFRYNIINYS